MSSYPILPYANSCTQESNPYSKHSAANSMTFHCAVGWFQAIRMSRPTLDRRVEVYVGAGVGSGK